MTPHSSDDPTRCPAAPPSCTNGGRSAAALVCPTDALRIIFTHLQPGHRPAARAACAAWADPDAIDLLVPRSLPPSPSAWAPWARLRCLDLRPAAALSPAALGPALSLLPSLTALALRETAPGLPLLGAVAAATTPPLLPRLRVLRLESVASAGAPPPVPAGSELATPFTAHPAAALALIGRCAEVDVAGPEAVWGLVAAQVAAGVGVVEGGEAGGGGDDDAGSSPPSSPRSAPEDDWVPDYGGGGVDDEEEGGEGGDNDAWGAAWEEEERVRRFLPPRPGAAASTPPPPPSTSPHPLPSVRRLSLDLAFPASPVRSPDTRAGHEPWVGDPATPTADAAADAALAGGWEARAAAEAVIASAVRSAEALVRAVLTLPSLQALSLTCPGVRDRGGLAGFDDWRRGAAAGAPSTWRPSVAAASGLAVAFRSALARRGSLPSLTSLTAAGWPFGPVVAEPASLSALSAAAPRLQTLRLDGGPHPVPELRAWGRGREGEGEGTLDPGAFAHLATVEVGPGLFQATGAALAAAAAAGSLPALRHLALSDSPAAPWHPHAAGDDPRLPPTVPADLGALLTGGALREVRCSASLLRGAWREGGGGRSGTATLVALDVRAAAASDALSAEDLGRLVVGVGSRALRALALPLGGGGHGDAWAAAFASLAASAPALASLTLELWGDGTAAGVVSPASLGAVLTACPIADLEVAGRMEATTAGVGDSASSRPPHHACGAGPACPALASALAAATHLRRVCVRRLEVCHQTVAVLLSAAPRLTTLVIVTDAPPALPPALAADLTARGISYTTPWSGPPSIPSPMHHLWWPGVGGGVGKTAVAGMDVRGGAGAGWPAGWRPAVGPPPGAASAGVLWWHTAAVAEAVTAGGGRLLPGDPEEGGDRAAAVVAGEADSFAAAAARWWEVPGF